MKDSMTSITPTFLLLSVALLIWSASAGLSQYLAGGLIREQESASVAAAPELGTLRQTASESAADPQAHLQLAFGLMRSAFENSDGAMLMEAVQSFNQVLELSPEHPEALLGLATLCLEAGIIDKALDFYPRYLAKRPEDMRAKSDYALALIRAAEFSRAEEILQEVLSVDPSFFPAQMTYAFSYRAQGDLQEARSRAMLARQFSPDRETEGQVDRFIQGIDKESSSPAGLSGAEPDNRSPAGLIDSYFRTHAIIGPKLETIRWNGSQSVTVLVSDFPVEQMPEYAKARFLENTREALSDLPEEIEIEVRDIADGSFLLGLKAGGV